MYVLAGVLGVFGEELGAGVTVMDWMSLCCLDTQIFGPINSLVHTLKAGYMH